MQIIQYEKEYKEEVIQLLIEVAVKEYGFIEFEKWFKIFENEKYKDNNGNCWIALNDDKKVIGTISLKNIDNISAEVKNMYVKKEYRGSGISQSLLDILTKFAKSKGYKRLQLDTYDRYERAIKFYHKNNFIVQNKIEDKYIYYKMLEQEKISVIVAIYNIEKYLEECIKSIIDQTYKNLQIILIDDGSTDSSGKICDKYAKKDQRIEVVHKENGGLADARNVGMELAKGKYISFIDGDDYIFPTFYEELYYMLERYNADISECQFLRIKENDIKQSDKIINKYNENINRKYEVYNGEEALKLLYGPKLQPYVKKVVVWNKLYTREVLESIKFPKGKLHEDEYTTFKILSKCKKIVSTNKVLHGYIQTKGSIMRREIKQKRIDDNLGAYIECSNFFKENGNKRLEMMCRRRYLEYCIELSGKVLESGNKEKERQIQEIQQLFIENYEEYIENIRINHFDNRENRIVELIENAYENIKSKNICIGDYWKKLEYIINEE